MTYPASGKTYKLSEIFELVLGDSPCLQIRDVGVVQDAHLSTEELLSIEGMADTNWTYLRTTNELIPVFQYSFANPSYLEFFDTEPYNNSMYPEDDLQWVTPKGSQGNKRIKKMIDLVKYYSSVVEGMKTAIEWMVFEKSRHPKDKVHKKHLNYLIRTRTKELNRTVKKMEKLKALNKPFDPFDYCEDVSDEMKQRILNSPSALDTVTRIARRIHNSPYKNTEVWRILTRKRLSYTDYYIHTRTKPNKHNAGYNRYKAFPNLVILTTGPIIEI